MKKIVFVLTIALMGTMVANAQPQRHHAPRGGHGSSEQMIEKRVGMLDEALSLTEEQKAEITKIYTAEAEAMSKERPARVENGEKREKPDEAAMKARREKMEAQHAATDAKIEALLTPEQLTKYAEVKKRGNRRGHDKRHDRKGDEEARMQDGGKPCTCPMPE